RASLCTSRTAGSNSSYVATVEHVAALGSELPGLSCSECRLHAHGGVQVVEFQPFRTKRAGGSCLWAVDNIGFLPTARSLSATRACLYRRGRQAHGATRDR